MTRLTWVGLGKKPHPMPGGALPSHADGVSWRARTRKCPMAATRQCAP